MATDIPSCKHLKALLEAMPYARVRALSVESGVPFTTIWKIRVGETTNPGIDTVAKFLPYLDGATVESKAA